MVSYAWIERLLESPPVPLQRAERVPICLPVVVTGYGSLEFFHALTFTIDVSRSGCCVFLPRQVDPGNLVFIGLAGGDGTEISPDSRALYQIAWAQRDGDGWVAGAKRSP